MASLTMIMNYSHRREYDNVTFPPNIVMTYFHQMDKWQLGICWTDMMMMARMRLIMTIMMLIVTRTGGENDHCNFGDKSTFVSLLSMLLEALVGCKLPSCSSSIGAAAKISSCQVVQDYLWWLLWSFYFQFCSPYWPPPFSILKHLGCNRHW